MALGGVGGWLALVVKRVLVLYFLQVYHLREFVVEYAYIP